MAYSERLVRYSYQAGDSIVKVVGVPGMPGSVEPNIGNQYKIAKFGTDKDVVELATAATDNIAGVTTTKPQHPKTAVAVAVSGIVPIQAGAPLAYLDRVVPDADGRAVKAGAGVAGIGFVVEAASAAGILASVQLELGR